MEKIHRNRLVQDERKTIKILLILTLMDSF